MARKFCAMVQAYDYTGIGDKIPAPIKVHDQALYATSMECLQRRVDAAVFRELDHASEVVVEYFKYSKSKQAWVSYLVTHDARGNLKPITTNVARQ